MKFSIVAFVGMIYNRAKFILRKAGTAVDNERDLLTFIDDDGVEYEMEVLEYFEYDGEEYAMLVDANNVHDEDCHDCDHECEETDVYLMQVATDDDTGDEVFMAIEDEKFDEIVNALDQFFDEDLDGDDSDEDEIEF